MAVYWIFTGTQNGKFKGSKYVFIKKPQYKRARENVGVYRSCKKVLTYIRHRLNMLRRCTFHLINFVISGLAI